MFIYRERITVTSKVLAFLAAPSTDPQQKKSIQINTRIIDRKDFLAPLFWNPTITTFPHRNVAHLLHQIKDLGLEPRLGMDVQWYT